MAGPKNRFVRLHLNNLGLDRENRKAAGTAHDTVGQPGIQIPAIANATNMLPKPMYNLLLNEEFSTEYLSTISSTDRNGSMIRPAYIWS